MPPASEASSQPPGNAQEATDPSTTSHLETLMQTTTVTDTRRYAKCIEVSKRVRWDIDRDVIRGRSFDFSPQVPARRPVADRRARLPDAGRAALAQPDPGPHLRQHVRPGRALHRRQDARGQPRPLARRPGRARGAGALHRRGAQAPGAVPPHRAHDRRRHARGLPVRRRAQRRRRRRAARKSTWAVLALTCHIELFTQVHYRESIEPRSTTSPSCSRTSSCFHWKEESQHAILDELEWRRENAAPRAAERDRRSTT